MLWGHANLTWGLGEAPKSFAGWRIIGSDVRVAVERFPFRAGSTVSARAYRALLRTAYAWRGIRSPLARVGAHGVVEYFICVAGAGTWVSLHGLGRGPAVAPNFGIDASV